MSNHVITIEPISAGKPIIPQVTELEYGDSFSFVTRGTGFTARVVIGNTALYPSSGPTTPVTPTVPGELTCFVNVTHPNGVTATAVAIIEVAEPAETNTVITISDGACAPVVDLPRLMVTAGTPLRWTNRSTRSCSVILRWDDVTPPIAVVLEPGMCTADISVTPDTPAGLYNYTVAYTAMPSSKTDPEVIILTAGI